MKRFQRIFLSLLAIFAVWFSMANAYTFEVRNRSPFGILNLKTLNLKPDTTHTGIILDWANYVIKIDPNHETDSWGIWVDQICDEKWDNCKKVSELWIWGWGAIVIEGNAENFCFKKDDTTLLCDNDFLRRLIESWWLGWSINIDGQDKNYCYRSKETNTLYCDNTNLPTWNWSTPGNGKITIIQWSNEREFFLNGTGDQKIILSNGGGTTNGAIAYWSDEYICVKNGDNLTCSKAKLGTLTADKRCTFDGTSINCNETKPSWGNGWTTYTAWTAIEITNDVISVKPNALLQPGYVAAPTQKWKCWKTDPITGQPLRWDCWWGWNWITLITWQNNKYCKYIWGTTKWIQCTYDAWSSTPTWSWDSLWKTDSSNRLTPKNGENLYFPSGTQIRFWWKIFFEDTWIHLSYIQITGESCQGTVWVIQMDNKWLRVWTNTCNEVYGISTLWKISAWMVGSCSANTITMYATWGSNSSNDHYEILWSNRLLVGTKGNSYIYFWNNGKVWINRTNLDDSKATVQIKWSLQISNCGTNTCDADNVWQMRYFETWNKWYFVWCRRKASGNWTSSFERVVLNDDNTPKTPTTNNCTVSVPYNTAEYNAVAPTICR